MTNKPLWKENGMEIGIFDRDNYYLTGTGPTQYFLSLDKAVTRVAKTEADDRSYDLHSWITEYRKTLKYMRDVMEGLVDSAVKP